MPDDDVDGTLGVVPAGTAWTTIPVLLVVFGSTTLPTVAMASALVLSSST